MNSYKQGKFSPSIMNYMNGQHQGENLSGCNFTDRGMREYQFQSAKLERTIFSYAILIDAEFQGANLKKSKF